MIRGGSTTSADVVLAWYASNGRDLAFRHTSDPWAILVSEVMAQQTQAARAAEAWTRFMDRFPTPVSLAAASPADVIREWRGLGYNRRAVTLRAAAISIVEQHGGRVPDTLEALIALPGIGPYTARAVLAIAFGRPVAALDVNIRRVVGRAFLPPTLATRDAQAAADRLVPTDRAAAWTHALMDIGAAFCRPREPRCAECPLRAACLHASQSTEEAVAGRAKPATTKRDRSPRFEATTRWLRGRIVERLRDVPDGTWLDLSGPIGEHDSAAVARAIAKLADDGLLEIDRSRGRQALRLATSVASHG